MIKPTTFTEDQAETIREVFKNPLIKSYLESLALQVLNTQYDNGTPFNTTLEEIQDRHRYLCGQYELLQRLTSPLLAVAIERKQIGDNTN